MNRHPVRWEGLAFGLFFLAIVTQWALWEQEVISPDDLGYAVAVILILLGLIGIAGTVLSGRSARRTAPHTPTPVGDPESDTTEEGPQS